MEVMLVVASVTVSIVESFKCQSTFEMEIRWKVDCSSLNLSSAPPAMSLHPVVVLNLSHNVFVHLIDSQFENWTEISHLDLSYNTINSIDNDAFKGLYDLTTLNLMNNYITVLSSNITGNLPKLKILNLFSNTLKLIRSETFKTVPLLLKLFLGSNVNLGEAQENYKVLNTSFFQGLITLNFDNTSWAVVPNNFFNGADHLISLSIANNPLRYLEYLPPALRYLNISGTLIEKIPSGLFSKSDVLQRLSIENMPLLRVIDKNTLKGLSNLEELYIKKCPQLSFISDEAFGEASPKLKRFDISFCALTTLPKTFKLLLSKDVYLSMEGNPWTCDGGISWITDESIPNHLSENLRCNSPEKARGVLLMDYFKPRSLHPHSSIIRAAVVVALAVVLVAGIVGMIRHISKQNAKSYRQLQDIRLQDCTPNTLTAS